MSLEDARCRRERYMMKENEWVGQSASKLQDGDVIREKITIRTCSEWMERWSDCV